MEATFEFQIAEDNGHDWFLLNSNIFEGSPWFLDIRHGKGVLFKK